LRLASESLGGSLTEAIERVKTAPGRKAAVLEKAPTSREEDRRAAILSNNRIEEVQLRLGPEEKDSQTSQCLVGAVVRQLTGKKCCAISSDRVELSIRKGWRIEDSRRHVLGWQTFLGYCSLHWDLRLTSGQSQIWNCQLRLRWSRNRQEQRS